MKAKSPIPKHKYVQSFPLMEIVFMIIFFVKVRALTTVIGTLMNCSNFPAEEYETFITKVISRHDLLENERL